MKVIEGLTRPLECTSSTSFTYDIFLTCGSFEERCVNSSSILRKSGKIHTSVIFNYKESSESKDRYISTMYDNLSHISKQTFIFPTESVSLPSKGIKKFIDYLQTNKIVLEKKKILIDITVFTKPYLFLLVKVLKEKYGIKAVDILYSEPLYYSNKETNLFSLGSDYKQYLKNGDIADELRKAFTKHKHQLPSNAQLSKQDEKWVVSEDDREKYHIEDTDGGLNIYKESKEIILTEGLDRIEAIPGFFGSSIHKKDALIVILGFEGKRSMEIYSTINPTRTYIVNGLPSFQPGWHRISLKNNLRFVRESAGKLYYASAVDPHDTLFMISNIVDEIANNDEEMNIIIAPLGTKMQAFGALLYALGHPKISVIYPFPSFFNPNYSEGIGSVWISKINLMELL